MVGNRIQVRLGVWEFAWNGELNRLTTPQILAERDTEEARHLPPSHQFRDMTARSYEISTPSGGLTAFRDSHMTPGTAAFPTFHTNQGWSYEIRKRQ
jgi:hypothetical protein